MENANDFAGTITPRQTEGGMWIVALDGRAIGDCQPQQTAEAALTWARKFFGPAFKYEL
jgi:hypothetical protein